MSAERVKPVGAELEELKIDIHRPSVVVVFGNVGVGKTAIAEEIARRLKSRVLSSDEFRKRLFRFSQYEAWQSNHVIQSMILSAQKMFRNGAPSVILDATFSKKRSREAAIDLARKHGRKIVWVEVVSNNPNRDRKNIEGIWVPRQIEEPLEIEQRIMVNNTPGEESQENRIKSLVDEFIVPELRGFKE